MPLGYNSGFRVYSVGFRVSGLGLRVQGSGQIERRSPLSYDVGIWGARTWPGVFPQLRESHRRDAGFHWCFGWGLWVVGCGLWVVGCGLWV